jgi:hypothetical protein
MESPECANSCPARRLMIYCVITTIIIIGAAALFVPYLSWDSARLVLN